MLKQKYIFQHFFKTDMKNKYRFLAIIFIALFTAGCSQKDNLSVAMQKYEIKSLPKINKDITLGGFSDLFYKDGYFYTITDRGPVSKKIKQDNKKYKIFLCDNYIPKILKLKIENNELKIVSINDINGVSALPTAPEKDTIALNSAHKELDFDKNGLDSESLIIDNENNYWIGDEYYPSILKVDEKFNVIKRFAPKNCKYKNPAISYILPEELNNIKKNKGFEAIAYDGKDKIYVFTQSALKNENYIGVTEFNIKTEKPEKFFRYIPQANEKISGAVYIKNSNKILTIGKLDDKPNLNILKIKQNSIIRKNFVILSEILKLEKYTKFEGITFDDKTNALYIINDNDFGLKQDNETKSFIIKLDLNKVIN